MASQQPQQGDWSNQRIVIELLGNALGIFLGATVFKKEVEPEYTATLGSYQRKATTAPEAARLLREVLASDVELVFKTLMGTPWQLSNKEFDQLLRLETALRKNAEQQ